MADNVLIGVAGEGAILVGSGMLCRFISESSASEAGCASGISMVDFCGVAFKTKLTAYQS